MTNCEPHLDADLLHTKILKAIDKKSDHICLKLPDFVSVIVTRPDKIDKALKRLPARPKSACILCTLEDILDHHTSGRCPRLSGTYARTFQISKMGLCGQCLKSAHEEECMVLYDDMLRTLHIPKLP
ncbi:unnamed protein product [Heligmosomoides polygyrus]|uniref:TRAF-type domain-containing protein n=1 Tax=Heligmosomoides polygyrus TaxID=6339 RepID=A0A183G7C4_HELPZ|nr:unnamed protein product [Heligmosomoides polygyrus]